MAGKNFSDKKKKTEKLKSVQDIGKSRNLNDEKWSTDVEDTWEFLECSFQKTKKQKGEK